MSAHNTTKCLSNLYPTVYWLNGHTRIHVTNKVTPRVLSEERREEGEEKEEEEAVVVVAIVEVAVAIPEKKKETTKSLHSIMQARTYGKHACKYTYIEVVTDIKSEWTVECKFSGLEMFLSLFCNGVLRIKAPSVLLKIYNYHVQFASPLPPLVFRATLPY